MVNQYHIFNLFNNYFASQCTPIKNGSKLPNLSYKTEKILTSFDIKADNILPIIKNVNVGKAHGWNQLSVRMIKICGDSIAFPLKLIFTYLLPVIMVEMRINKFLPEVSILHYVYQIWYVCIVIPHRCFWIAEWLSSSFLMWEKGGSEMMSSYTCRQ